MIFPPWFRKSVIFIFPRQVRCLWRVFLIYSEKIQRPFQRPSITAFLVHFCGAWFEAMIAIHNLERKFDLVKMNIAMQQVNKQPTNH